MPSSQTTLISSVAPSPAPVGAARVLREVNVLCEALQVGDFIPTQAELMRRFDASERSVRWVLETLKRQGKIVSRKGSGAYIAEPIDVLRFSAPLEQKNSVGILPSNSSLAPSLMVDERTVVAVARPDNGFFDRAMSRLLFHTEDADLNLVSRFIDPQKTALAALLNEKQRPLGYILFRYDMHDLAKQLQEAGQRVVLVGTPPLDVLPEVCNVYSDHEQGGYIAAKHLLDLGHRRLAFRGGTGIEQSQRWRGAQRALSEGRRKGWKVDLTALIDEETDRWRHDTASAEAYFARLDAPTGVMVWNDYEAIVLLSFLTHWGIRVPDKVSVVGYDNIPEGKKLYPALTTIDSAMEHQLQTAMLLLQSSTPLTHNRSFVVLPNLIQRDSTASAASL